MKIIEVTETKLEKMSGCVEEMLRIGGKLMSCIEEMEEGEKYGNRMGYRENEMYEDMPQMMGERYVERYGQRGRRRDSMGRYM